MKDFATKASHASGCTLCGDGADAPSNLEIVIRRGHVRRASLAADGVYMAARGTEGIENGVVLMSAILLIARLATAHHCDPRSVLSQIARCFEIKEAYVRAPKAQN